MTTNSWPRLWPGVSSGPATPPRSRPAANRPSKLPPMDGLAVLARLKELHPELEVILLTAHGSIETAIQAMRKGAYDYLTKPFHLPELEVHIDKAFEKVRLARRERQWVQQLQYESPRY